ncbi:hypothetical protein Rctr85_044 [Virus Rctr85]|nr:hypothetical protein Rctr85_044 [Virus Rctr85]
MVTNQFSQAVIDELLLLPDVETAAHGLLERTQDAQALQQFIMRHTVIPFAVVARRGPFPANLVSWIEVADWLRSRHTPITVDPGFGWEEGEIR